MLLFNVGPHSGGKFFRLCACQAGDERRREAGQLFCAARACSLYASAELSMILPRLKNSDHCVCSTLPLSSPETFRVSSYSMPTDAVRAAPVPAAGPSAASSASTARFAVFTDAASAAQRRLPSAMIFCGGGAQLPHRARFFFQFSRPSSAFSLIPRLRKYETQRAISGNFAFGSRHSIAARLRSEACGYLEPRPPGASTISSTRVVLE